MDLYALLIEPFAAYGFMRRALAAVIALAVACGPLGVLLTLRRLSLMGDALAHGVLPGAALGFLAAGLSLWAMTLGGLIAGLAIVLAAGLVARGTIIREDASLAGFYMLSLAFGVLILSLSGSNVELLHVLFGSILSVDAEGLVFVACVATVAALTLAVIYRPLLIESVDPGFLRVAGYGGTAAHLAFLALLVLSLVAGFQALGTLMSVGLLILPAVTARFWARQVHTMMAAATGIAAASGLIGLLLSYHLNAPSGPAIVLTAGVAYLVSIVAGAQGSLLGRYWRRPHVHIETERPA